MNGTPSGDAGFEAKCLATGGFEFSGEFRDIEGACVDGHLNYNCDCNAGFEAVSISNGDTCLEINEWDEWNGGAACFPGSCSNLIESFSCACPT